MRSTRELAQDISRQLEKVMPGIEKILAGYLYSRDDEAIKSKVAMEVSTYIRHHTEIYEVAAGEDYDFHIRITSIDDTTLNVQCYLTSQIEVRSFNVPSTS